MSKKKTVKAFAEPVGEYSTFVCTVVKANDIFEYENFTITGDGATFQFSGIKECEALIKVLEEARKWVLK